MSATLVASAAQRPAADGTASKEARRLFADLMAVAPPIRREFAAGLNARDWQHVLAVAAKQGGTPFCLWQDDPVGFIEDVLGESTWSKQRMVAEALTRSKRVAVPSGVGLSKTHTAARMALWRAIVFPIGSSITVTIAPRFRQVKRLLWPHIRQCVAESGLPVTADTVQLKALAPSGVETVIAYGFSAPPHEESAIQGIHEARLFLVIDEAGGLARPLGVATRNILTGDDSRMLAIGNPPTDDEGGWFEELCSTDGVEVIPISVLDSPAITGENTGPCLLHPDQPTHGIGIHLTDRSWLDDAIAEHGEDSPFVQAKAYAKFPRGGSNRILPYGWLEAAQDLEWEPEPGTPGYLPLSAVEGADRPWMVKRGAWVRLGVDVAADGGDEFAIARVVGDLVTNEHHSSGAVNHNATDVAGVVLQHIIAAQNLATHLGTTAPVRVKVDANGIGWGVVGILQAWGSEGVHTAQIVPVMVSEATGRDPDPAATFRPMRKRDEMWTNARALLQPVLVRPEDGGKVGALRLRVDRKTIAQLSAPMYGTSATGLTVIESKKSMKARGVPSPDRGEAALLGLYEPAPKERRGVGVRLIV